MADKTRVEHHDPLTTGERIADAFAAGIGSWRFIIIQTICVILWVVLNIFGLTRHWDEFPFILLNLVAAMRNIDGAMEESALNLGARGWRLFRRVIFPLAGAQ